jgi:hypothetical protein
MGARVWLPVISVRPTRGSAFSSWPTPTVYNTSRTPERGEVQGACGVGPEGAWAPAFRSGPVAIKTIQGSAASILILPFFRAAHKSRLDRRRFLPDSCLLNGRTPIAPNAVR